EPRVGALSSIYQATLGPGTAILAGVGVDGPHGTTGVFAGRQKVEGPPRRGAVVAVTRPSGVAGDAMRGGRHDSELDHHVGQVPGRRRVDRGQQGADRLPPASTSSASSRISRAVARLFSATL